MFEQHCADVRQRRRVGEHCVYGPWPNVRGWRLRGRLRAGAGAVCKREHAAIVRSDRAVDERSAVHEPDVRGWRLPGRVCSGADAVYDRHDSADVQRRGRLGRCGDVRGPDVPERGMPGFLRGRDDTLPGKHAAVVRCHGFLGGCGGMHEPSVRRRCVYGRVHPFRQAVRRQRAAVVRLGWSLGERASVWRGDLIVSRGKVRRNLSSELRRQRCGAGRLRANVGRKLLHQPPRRRGGVQPQLRRGFAGNQRVGILRLHRPEVCRDRQ